MAQQPERKRPSYEPNKEYARQLRAQTGLSVVRFAETCDCGETTWRKIEHGERVDADTLQGIAARLKVPWHDLLSEAEKVRLGVGQPGHAPGKPQAGPPPASPATALAVQPGSRLFQLPAALADFTGREEQIRTTARRLGGETGRGAIPALRGMGGVGKTSLAVRVAHEVKGLFPDAQLFVELRGAGAGVKEDALTPAEVMRQVIRAFQPEAVNLSNDEKELAGFYRSVLAGKRALIVLDNAADEAQLRPLLTVPGPVGFLITCRHAQALDGVESVLLEGLTQQEAFSLLRGITGARGTREELQAIVELCCRLPLALRVAGDFLRLKIDWPVSRYIEALQGEPHRWLKVGADPEKDVEAVLKLSSAQLVRDSVERGTRWHLLHIFEGDFDLQAAAAVWDAGDDDLGVLNDLSDLENRSLISFDRSTQRYKLHDLLRPIAEGLFG
jgi:transcriptional regulator with XRE-family HTH domain